MDVQQPSTSKSPPKKQKPRRSAVADAIEYLKEKSERETKLQQEKVEREMALKEQELNLQRQKLDLDKERFDMEKAERKAMIDALIASKLSP